MGKKKDATLKVKELIIPIPNSINDIEILCEPIIHPQAIDGWINTVATSFGLPTGIEKDRTIKEIEELLILIRVNGTTGQIELASAAIEVARTKLRNIKIG